MCTSTEFISEISAPTISTSFDFRDLVKGRLMCIVLCSNIVQITMHVLFLSRSLVTPRHRCVIMHEVDAYKAHFKTPFKSWNAQLDKSLCKICHYQQNVQQHYYLWDTLVHKLVSAFVVCINYLPYKKIIDAHAYAYIHYIDHEAFFTGLFSHGTLTITVHNKTNKLKYA